MSKLQYIADRLEAGLAARNNGHLVDERKVIWSGNGDYSKVLSHTGFCVIKECLEGDLLSISKKAGYVTVLDNCLYYFYEKMYVWFSLPLYVHTVVYTILCNSTYCPHQIQHAHLKTPLTSHLSKRLLRDWVRGSETLQDRWKVQSLWRIIVVRLYNHVLVM